jgi:flagellar biosynthesis protein FlhA
VGDEARKMMMRNLQPMILVHPIIRGKLRRFLERYVQGVTVISHNEIPPQIRVQSAGVIKTGDE